MDYLVHLSAFFIFALFIPTSSVPVQQQSKLEGTDSARNVEDTIFTVPLISHDIDRQPRVRRSEQSSQYMNIILPTPNKDVVLRMEASDSLLVPGATYELRKGNVSTATPVRNDCFFQGKVVGSNDSFVALSVCNGLIGVYELDGEQYSIEPLHLEKAVDGADLQRLHKIQRMNKTGHEELIDRRFELMANRSNRRRRAVGQSDQRQKFLEVMVVIDRTIIDFHGEENTELFVLALFNMMNLIYSHNSLGVDIKLSLVKLVLLEDDAADEMWIEEDPRTTLDKFCMWAAVNSLREHEVGHYDFAMYLSRDRMSPAGYAPVTGMCRPDRSCALIKEDGFSTSFVAAHEIGHTIGMTHDGEGSNKCVNEPKRGSIMAPLVMANLHNYFWSPCSKDEIDSIVSTLYCMNDNPFDVNWSELEMPLGRNWDLDDQCVKDFGVGFKLCSRVTHNFNPCEHLWCSTPGNRYLCKTKRAPPLPGSTCGRDRWCFNSQCIVANPDDPIWLGKSAQEGRLKSIDGGWSRWSSWSECSTSCDRGIKSRTRTCTDPKPALGGKDCEGDEFELRLCNLPEQMRLVCKMFSSLSFSVRRSCMKHKVFYRTCEKVIDDVRQDQCSKYNKRGRTYKPFEPHMESDHCLLNCRTVEEDIPLYGQLEAVDGTFCSYDDRHSMCYSGKCVQVGCDGKLYSEAKDDMCGVCRGDNSNCTLRQDYFNNKVDRGYSLLVRLYPGTRNFRIKKPDDAYKIVVRNVRTNKTILTEVDRSDMSVVDFGTLWKYETARSQILQSNGPLQSEYDVFIYSVYSGLRASLSISFTEPLTVVRDSDVSSSTSEEQRAYQGMRAPSPPRKTKYMWKTEGWGECSEACGEGIQDQQYVCVNTLLNRTVHDLLCKTETRPETIKKTCNLKPCFILYRWVTSEWTKCPDNVCVVEQFTQKRWAFCVKDSPETELKWQRVKDNLCENMDMPELEIVCNTSHCKEPGYWKTGQFSPCSSSCGIGTQSRDVTCHPINSESNREPDCSVLAKPSESEACMLHPCTTIGTTSTSTAVTTKVSSILDLANTVTSSTSTHSTTDSLDANLLNEGTSITTTDEITSGTTSRISLFGATQPTTSSIPMTTRQMFTGAHFLPVLTTPSPIEGSADQGLTRLPTPTYLISETTTPSNMATSERFVAPRTVSPPPSTASSEDLVYDNVNIENYSSVSEITSSSAAMPEDIVKWETTQVTTVSLLPAIDMLAGSTPGLQHTNQLPTTDVMAGSNTEILGWGLKTNQSKTTTTTLDETLSSNIGSKPTITTAKTSATTTTTTTARTTATPTSTTAATTTTTATNPATSRTQEIGFETKPSTRFVWWWTASTTARQDLPVSTRTTQPTTRFVWWWTSTKATPTTTATERSNENIDSVPTTSLLETQKYFETTTNTLSTQSSLTSENEGSTRFVWWWTSTKSQMTESPLPITDQSKTSATTRFIWWWTSTTQPPTTALRLLNDEPISTSTMRPPSNKRTRIEVMPTFTAATALQTTSSILTDSKKRSGSSENSYRMDNSLPILSESRYKNSFIEATSKQDHKMSTTISNLVQDNLGTYSDPQQCDSDMSSICELMSAQKCRLLLFQKLCCRTCILIL